MHMQVCIENKKEGQKMFLGAIKMFSVQVIKKLSGYAISWLVVNLSAIARWVALNKTMLL